MLQRRQFLGLLAGSSVAASAQAQDALPQTITLIVPQEAGSSPDVYARIIADELRVSLGRAIVIENRSGASGNVGAQAVARAPADGATLLLGSSGLCEINHLIFETMRWSMSDFAPIVKGAGAVFVLAAHPSVPARTLDELVAWAKTREGLAYASYAAGSPGHFLGAQLNTRFGLELAHLPYRGSASQATALVSGHALFGFALTQSVLGHVESGALRALAVTSENRFRLMPGVPTFRELGYPEFSILGWFGLLARASTPAPLLRTLTRAAVAAHENPRVRDLLLAQGLEALSEGDAAFAKSIEAGTARWAALVKATGFRLTE